MSDTLRICYVAKHNSGGNDDEGAITYSLEKLGCKVQCIHERDGRTALKARGDVLLFHKWSDIATISLLRRRLLRVFWYFDLVDYPDYTIRTRCQARMNWMRDITPNVELGFCTDGDWVKRSEDSKLIHLMQGADERKFEFYKNENVKEERKILFTGTSKGGNERWNFLTLLSRRYGHDFVQVESGLYGRDLAREISKTSIIIAPDAPVTDSYFSNRVYLTLGFGGFLLHPNSKLLREQYQDGIDLAVYANRMELFQQIDYYLTQPEKRREIAENGYKKTKTTHTYTERCKTLLYHIEERLRAIRDG